MIDESLSDAGRFTIDHRRFVKYERHLSENQKKQQTIFERSFGRKRPAAADNRLARLLKCE